MEQLTPPDLNALVAAKASCCSGLIQLATAVDQALAAALSRIGAWLIGGGYLWIGAAAGVLVIAFHRHRAGLVSVMAQTPPLGSTPLRS